MRRIFTRLFDRASADGKRWSFSNGNAGTRYTPFYRNVDELGILDWNAIAATEWKDPFVKERKQAEFLFEGSFPWDLIERIGVIDESTKDRVTAMLDAADHRPQVVVARNWYY